VRDVFLFCCFTGLAFADVKKLKASEIRVGIDGNKWIFTNRRKTDTLSRIPILPIALEILEQYKDYPACIILKNGASIKETKPSHVIGTSRIIVRLFNVIAT
jgi:hypothetical protein